MAKSTKAVTASFCSSAVSSALYLAEKDLIFVLLFDPPPPTPSYFPLTEREHTKGLFILNAFITSWISLVAEQCNRGMCFRGEQQVRRLDLFRVFRISIQGSVAVFTFAAGEKLHIRDTFSNM